MFIAAIIRLIMSIVRREQSQKPEGDQPAGGRQPRRQQY